jgi:hypothetical protein
MCFIEMQNRHFKTDGPNKSRSKSRSRSRSGSAEARRNKDSKKPKKSGHRSGGEDDDLQRAIELSKQTAEREE